MLRTASILREIQKLPNDGDRGKRPSWQLCMCIEALLGRVVQEPDGGTLLILFNWGGRGWELCELQQQGNGCRLSRKESQADMPGDAKAWMSWSGLQEIIQGAQGMHV